jgi:hypothetical protein
VENMKTFLFGPISILLFLILVGCIPGSVQGGQMSATFPALTSTPVDLEAIQTPTIEPAIAGDESSKIITLDNNGQQIRMHPDETVLLKLGEVYQWTIDIDDQTVISRIPNIIVIRGAQGIYKAHQTGKATLSADGDPLCRQSRPACGMPSIQFTLQIEVLP